MAVFAAVVDSWITAAWGNQSVSGLVLLDEKEVYSNSKLLVPKSRNKDGEAVIIARS